MPARPANTLASVFIVFLLAQAIACAQSQNSLDITLPSSYIVNATKAYDSVNNNVEIWGPIEIFKSSGSLYVSVPTNAPAGSKLALFKDTGTGALFRNNTLVLPIAGSQGPVANLALMTGDMASDGNRFYGQVTDIELDTMALRTGDSAIGAGLYLNEWPDRPDYRVSLSNNDTVKKAILDEAAKTGQMGTSKLLLDVAGTTPASVRYVIVRMKVDGMGSDGNVSAYRYLDGIVSRLTCKEIRSDDSVIYETISAGGGTFAFVGPFPEPPPVRAGIRNILMFAGALALSLAVIVGLTIKSMRWLTRKE